MIVDDEADVVDYLTAVLQNNNYRVITAHTAGDGYRLAKEEHPDLICLDIMMPTQSGLSLYVRLRRHRLLADIPVIIISGMEKEQEFNFRDYVYNKKIRLPDKYLEKPIDPITVMNQIQKITGETS